MNFKCFFGSHQWNGCKCESKIRDEQHNWDGCIHNWAYYGSYVNCSTYSSRGSGQHLDPCYGASCPCEGYSYEYEYKCQKCGALEVRKT